jgi:DNA-binding winged helix-turn-helix (wHTH) protein/Tol biopolymer transport system component
VPSTTAQRKIRFGPFELDRQSGELFKLGHKLNLRGQPIDVLSILLEHPGEVVTREELCKLLWPQDTFVDFEHSLNTDIKKLRQALDDDADTPKYIETLPKKGYRFVATVEPVANTANDADSSTLTIEATKSSQPTPASISHRWLWVTASVLLLSALTAGATYWWYLVRRPVVTGIHQLTRTGHPKSTLFDHRPQTDGARVYFDELVDGRWRTAQVSVKGGEVSYIDISPLQTTAVTAISADGSELALWDRGQVEGGNPQTSYWTFKLPNGPARRIPGTYNRGSVEFIPGWQQILFQKWPSDPNHLYVANLDGSGERQVLSPATPLDCFDYSGPTLVSPDKWIRFCAGKKVWESRLDGTHIHPVSTESRYAGGFYWVPGWSPDGRTYVFATGRNRDLNNLWAVRELRLFSHLFTSRPRQLTNGPIPFTYFTFSKDGKQLFALGEVKRGELSVYDSDSKTFNSYLGGLSGAFADFSRDGQWVTYVSYPLASLWRSRIDGSERLQLTFPEMGEALNPRWSPDGRFIAFMTLTGGPKIYLIPAEGGSPMLLLSNDSQPMDPTWFPDGKKILYGGVALIWGRKSEITIFDLETKTSKAIPGSNGMFSPRLSPDGRYIAAESQDFSKFYIYGFESQRWQLVYSLAQKGMRLGWPAWSHDSNWVYVGTESEIYRIRVADGRVESAASIEGIQITEPLWGGPWFGLTPDDRVIVMRNRGSDEVYALDLEYR